MRDQSIKLFVGNKLSISSACLLKFPASGSIKSFIGISDLISLSDMYSHGTRLLWHY